LKEAQNNVTAAQQRLDLTKLNNLPTVSGQASYTYVQPKIVLPFPAGPNGKVEDFQFAAVHDYGASINGSYTLLDFGRLKANIEKSKTSCCIQNTMSIIIKARSLSRWQLLIIILFL
jgi:outer membrane protein TolC